MNLNSNRNNINHLQDDYNIITPNTALHTSHTDTHHPDSSLLSYYSMNIGTLNCRGLTKSADPLFVVPLFVTSVLARSTCLLFKKHMLQLLRCRILFMLNFKLHQAFGLNTAG